MALLLSLLLYWVFGGRGIGVRCAGNDAHTPAEFPL
jgi:hypothetical protein